MKKSQPPELVGAQKASEMLGITIRQVNNLCNQGPAGPFPGARKLDPAKLRSSWLIPLDEIKSEQKQRAQAEEA